MATWRGMTEADVNKYYAWALAASAGTGWDPDVIFSQWILETGNFTSPNFRNNNNIAGQTWHSGLPASMKGTARPKNEGGYYIKYQNPVQGYVDFVNNNPRYNNVKNTTDEKEQIRRIKEAGWAVDPNYVSKLNSILGEVHSKGLNSPIQKGDYNTLLSSSGVSYGFTNLKNTNGEERVNFENFQDESKNVYYMIDKTLQFDEFSLTDTITLPIWISKNASTLVFRITLIIIGLFLVWFGLKQASGGF